MQVNELDREWIAKIVADYQTSVGLPHEDAWQDGWGIADAIIAALRTKEPSRG